MITPWRLLVAAALNVTMGVGISAAQTVMIRHAPPGETIETVLNATKAGSGTANAEGEARVPLSLSPLSKTEIDANIFVDVCDKLHRVIVVERTKLPDPQQPGCTRKDIPGLYWVRPVNTLVVDVADATPSLLLVKGSYNPGSLHTWTPAPRGVVVSAGSLMGWYRDVVNAACGNVSGCSQSGTDFGFTGGATVWLWPFLGADVTYVKPRNLTVQGSGDTFNFTHTLDTDVLTVSGKVGAPIGPVRLYGQAGMDYVWAKSSLSETINDLTITVNDVPQTIPGGTQASSVKTEGWGWAFGGGGEVWLGKWIALYADLNFAQIKGEPKGGGDTRINDQLRYVAFGGRVHIGR
jgi:hypothetical protein